MSRRLRRHRVCSAASSSPRAPTVFRNASRAERSIGRPPIGASGPRLTAGAAGGIGRGRGAGAITPASNADEATPLVEAAIVNEPELLDDPTRGPVVGADADVHRTEPGNGRG